MVWVLAWCLALQVLLITAEGERCGSPGRPVNGTVTSLGRFYFPGERVAYTCLEGFVLFGPGERTCRNNGTWSHHVPLCDFNLARGKRTLQSDTLWSYSPGLAVDGDQDTCSFTPRSPEPRWWQVHLGHKFNVMSVGVTISPGSFQEFTIYVIELLADNKALYKPCTTFKGVFQTHKALFHCNDRLGHPGQFVYIRDDRKDQEYFGLCEVEVFAFRERIPCGEPEVPVEGIVERVGENKAKYSCSPGHTLHGDFSLSCSSKGKWQGQPPRCREVHCPAPPNIPQGFIEISNFGGVYVFGTEARYACNPGHVLRGLAIRKCSHTGNWDNKSPECEAVSCGPPPDFANAKVSLLSGSTDWNDIAVYTCQEGHTLRQSEGNPVTTCLDSGEWKLINMTCEATPATSPIWRDGDRSLNVDEPPKESTVQLVAALAAVAGVLCIVVVIVALLAVRRHLLTSGGSRNPLVKEKPPPGHGGDIYQIHPRVTVRDQNKLSGPALLQHNLLETLKRPRTYNSTNNYDQNDDLDFSVLSDHEPPYEKVCSRSEHSYETIRKKSLAPSMDFDSSEEHISQDPGYETLQGDKESIGYEVVRNTKDIGYEVVQNKNHEYETVKEKDPGYETVKEALDPGYEIVIDKNELISSHGYETLKSKKANKPDQDDNNLEPIPDILQNITSDVCSSGGSLSDVPPEICALYAKVDKSKKKNRMKMNAPKLESINSDEITNIESTLVESPIDPAPTGSPPTRDLIRKFDKIFSETDQTKNVTEIECYSATGTLRPLPPLPNSSNQ